MRKIISKYLYQTAIVLLRTMLIFTVFAGWNGFLYPDLTFENGVAKVYTEEGMERKGLSGRDLFERLLDAEPERIRIKSRLAEYFFSFIS